MNLKNLLAELLSGDDERAEAAIPRLAASGPEGIAALKRCLSDSNPDTRWWAVRALAEFPHAQTTPVLVNALSDEDIAVRQCAALALRHQPHDRAVPALIQALHGQDPMLANLAADALIAIGAPAVPSLIDVMQNSPQKVRLVAVRALARIGDHRSIPVLYEALSEDSVLMEYWASEGLERMGVGMAFFKP